MQAQARLDRNPIAHITVSTIHPTGDCPQNLANVMICCVLLLHPHVCCNVSAAHTPHPAILAVDVGSGLAKQEPYPACCVTANYLPVLTQFTCCNQHSCQGGSIKQRVPAATTELTAACQVFPAVLGVVYQRCCCQLLLGPC